MIDFLCLLIKAIIKHARKSNAWVCLTVLLIIFNLLISNISYADNLNNVIARVSNTYQVPTDLIYQVIEAESGFNAYAVSHADARGLMQITRPTWDWVCRDLLQVSWSFDEDAFNREKNIVVGTRFLSWINKYLDKHAEELNADHNDLLLACYNAGPGTVRKCGFRIPPYKETQNYVSRINSGLNNHSVHSLAN